MISTALHPLLVHVPLGLAMLMPLVAAGFACPVASRALTAFVVAATVGVARLGVRTGHAGGQLVYVHGAAGAYTSTAQTPSGKSSTPPSAARRHDDD